ncbi:hypothetical protein RJT34_11864 [Clitoria ternatea]|uniref:Uncharacterized protein n=1 Tax=Clitoria ternatea TaxID=43366 RepID=A0AAN9PKF0_CLITE
MKVVEGCLELAVAGGRLLWQYGSPELIQGLQKIYASCGGQERVARGQPAIDVVFGEVVDPNSVIGESIEIVGAVGLVLGVIRLLLLETSIVLLLFFSGGLLKYCWGLLKVVEGCWRGCLKSWKAVGGCLKRLLEAVCLEGLLGGCFCNG